MDCRWVNAVHFYRCRFHFFLLLHEIDIWYGGPFLAYLIRNCLICMRRAKYDNVLIFCCTKILRANLFSKNSNGVVRVKWRFVIKTETVTRTMKICKNRLWKSTQWYFPKITTKRWPNVHFVINSCFIVISYMLTHRFQDSKGFELQVQNLQFLDSFSISHNTLWGTKRYERKSNHSSRYKNYLVIYETRFTRKVLIWTVAFIL